ncbi:D-alanine--D-alanine ligase [Saccharibacter sp. 17.LH.SD]|uniref:D-alanine--D-alanine ligase n=1 Tax=Saccharibacter sp. 17.LH.SD TaxID=2689393 RepID=UPI0013709596|nr:D-alanine--D-alanine ligase [Saccharibacter sp. 17.LH.SD]MXV44674.1 D-alanine--D-alanine ligase [Saccharibacter sp. 17.LH.SD]
MDTLSHDPAQSSPRIAVLMGGTSSERPVSLSSGGAALTALKAKGYDAHAIDVGPDIAATITALRHLAPNVVFNALHGPGGEDGRIQGVLDWLSLRYTHSGVLASAIAMDKAATRVALEAAGLPIAKGCVISPTQLYEADPLPRPYVVKPVAEGSSVGVHIVRPGDNRRQAIAENWSFGDRILAEDFIPGRELTVAVLNDTPLAVTEILPQEAEGFYDFEAKYNAGGSRHLIPAPLPDAITQQALMLASQAHQALGCRGASRTDFRYDEHRHRLIILEVNTQPGMTPTSLLPEQAAWRGMDYPTLCHWMVEDALHDQPYPVQPFLKDSP